MKTIKKIWSILLVCGLILVPTISVSAAEQEPEKVEVSFFNENGEEVSVSEEIADSFMEQLDVDKEVNIVSDKNLRASCTHIPCNQVKTTLYGHAKVSPTECWVYTKRVIMCKCCGAALKSLSDWQFAYSPLELMFRDYPGEIWVARKDSPMIIGVADGETYVASDVPAILKYTRNVYYIGNLEFARLTPGEAHFFNLDGDEIEKQTTEIKWDAEAAEKAGFEHFMMKEIHEQPKAVQDTLSSVIKNNGIDLSSVEITEEEIQKFEQIYIVACGSAWHVGMAAQYVIEDLVDVPVRVDLASEFRYRKMPINKNSLVIVISQSGETADTLAALRLAKEKGITTLAIVNVVGSSIAREADKVFYTLAGPEISVATTKAYSAQLVAMYCLAVQFARVRNTITEEQYGNYITELLTIPDKIQKILQDKERLQWFAAKYANAHDVFFVGRGIDYAISLEGSLKLKEISYIHSEAYAAGELKHGTISLIEPGTLVIGVLTQSDLYEKTISNMLECKSRGAYLMGLTTYGKYEIEDQVNFAVYVPKIDEHFVGSLAVVPLQLMGYYVSVAKGLDVDKPRNLAKSVTVE